MTKLILRVAAIAAVLASAAAPVIAGEADAISVNVVRTAADVYRFEVTVRHDDEGWEHYADRWEVLAPDGTVLATRVLAHPHEHEQPFTRALGGVAIPAGTTHVLVRAHDSVHGHGGREIRVEMSEVR